MVASFGLDIGGHVLLCPPMYPPIQFERIGGQFMAIYSVRLFLPQGASRDTARKVV